MKQTILKRSLAISELTHISRWEEDDGAVFEIRNRLPHVAEANTAPSMDVSRNIYRFGNTSKGEPK